MTTSNSPKSGDAVQPGDRECMPFDYDEGEWAPVIEAQYQELAAVVVKGRPDACLERIRSAFDFAREKHRPHVRESREPYITHPIAVARIIADLGLDEVSLISALLHDLVEMSDVTVEDIRAMFGDDVALIVDGVTKLERIVKDVFSGERIPQTPIRSDDPDRPVEDPHVRRRREDARRAANLRHLFFAVAEDLRVILVKLADRLHNMRTLKAKASEDQRRIGSETEQMYAPLAHRVGIWQIKWELEDLAFRYADPEEYERIAALVAQTRAERQSEVDEAVSILQTHLVGSGLTNAHVTGRAKHLYSIYQKMRNQGVDFADIYDLVALRVIVPSRNQCYEALGFVSAIWRPLPHTYADYISKSKSNLYQSLHVKVIGPQGKPIEVQIRTWDMHRTAEFGVAAHWAYKEHGEGGQAVADMDRRISQLRKELFEWSRDAPDSGTFLRQVLQNLFGDQVLVFTPKGDPIDLPAGATIVDFAYRIHSDVGHRAIGAKVNNRFAPLSYECKSGDTIEVVTRAGAVPGRDWLTLARTAHARAKIKSYFRRLSFDENADRGRALLQSEAERTGIEPQKLRDERLREVAKDLNYPGPRELLAALGNGSASLRSVLRRLAPAQPLQPRGITIGPRRADDSRLRVTLGGLDNVMYRRSRCCLPLPREDVVGYVSRGRGIVLHRATCPNLRRYQDLEAERVVPVEYTVAPGQVLAVSMRVVAIDRRGLLADLSTVITDLKVNITRVNTQSHKDGTATLSFGVEVRDAIEYNRMSDRIHALPDIISVDRPTSGMGRDQ